MHLDAVPDRNVLERPHAGGVRGCRFTLIDIGQLGHAPLRLCEDAILSIAEKLWTMEDIAELVEAAAPKPGRPVTYKSVRRKSPDKTRWQPN